MEGLMKVKDVAEYLGICEKSVWNLTHVSRELPFVRAGKCVRYVPEHIRNWVEQKAAEREVGRRLL